MKRNITAQEKQLLDTMLMFIIASHPTGVTQNSKSKEEKSIKEIGSSSVNEDRFIVKSAEKKFTVDDYDTQKQHNIGKC